MRRALLVVCLIAGLAPMTFGQAGLLLEWDHDGLYTDGYAVVIDGVRQAVSATCTGAGAARVCTWPLPTLAAGSHTIVVIAVGPGGEAASAPFTFGPPAPPGAVRVRKV